MVSKGGKALAIVTWLTPFAVVAAAGRHWFPANASEHGADIDVLMGYLLVAAGGLLFAGHLALGYFLWRFGGAKSATYTPLSYAQEKRWALVPAVVMGLIAEGGVLVLGMPVWAKMNAQPPADAVQVEITAEQFAWNIHYPGKDGKFGRVKASLLSLDNPLGLDKADPSAKDDLILIGELHLPVNRAARIRLRSKDVLHSFMLPMQRVKQDVVPGMTIDVWFKPTKAGDFEIGCAELCGMGHYQMRGLLRVESQEQFDNFLSELPTVE
jgi:cytochrome c oxidase subunit II